MPLKRLPLLLASLAALGLHACAKKAVVVPAEEPMVLIPMAPREACKDEVKPDEKPTCGVPDGGVALLPPCGPEPVVIAKANFLMADGGLTPCRVDLPFAMPSKPANSSPMVIPLGK